MNSAKLFWKDRFTVYNFRPTKLFSCCILYNQVDSWRKEGSNGTAICTNTSRNPSAEVKGKEKVVGESEKKALQTLQCHSMFCMC